MGGEEKRAKLMTEKHSWKHYAHEPDPRSSPLCDLILLVSLEVYITRSLTKFPP